MAQETNQSQGPLLCTTGCGFYGNPRNSGMCSVCYKDFLQRQNSNGRVSPQGSSSACSSLGDSLLAQCSESSTVDVPSASSHTHSASGHTSSFDATIARFLRGEHSSYSKPEDRGATRRGKISRYEHGKWKNKEMRSPLALRDLWMTRTKLQTNPKPRRIAASPAVRKWASQGLTADVVMCSVACTDTPTSTAAASTTRRTQQRRSGRRTPSSSERRSRRSKRSDLGLSRGRPCWFLALPLLLDFVAVAKQRAFQLNHACLSENFSLKIYFIGPRFLKQVICIYLNVVDCDVSNRENTFNGHIWFRVLKFLILGYLKGCDSINACKYLDLPLLCSTSP